MKHLLILLIVVFLVGCSNNDTDLKIMSEQTTGSADVKTVVKSTLDHITYDDGYVDWRVYSFEYTNVHHPNGYVIFTKIIKDKKDEYKLEKWEIDYSVSNYIEDIHYQLKSKFNGETEVSDVLLQTDTLFQGAFRTAEAIYLAYKETGENPVLMDAVIRAAERMYGRQTGLIRE